MSKSRTIILILVLIFILIVIILVQILTEREGPQSKPQSTIPPVVQQIPSATRVFYITNTTLINTPIGITDNFSIFFSKPIASDGLILTIKPEVPVSLTFDESGSVLTVTPIRTWDFDTEYRLLIKKETSSSEGYKLDSDVAVIFKTASYGGI